MIGLQAPIGLSAPIGLWEHRASCPPHFPPCTPQGPMLEYGDKDESTCNPPPDGSNDPDEHEGSGTSRKKWVRKGFVPVHGLTIGPHRIQICTYNKKIGMKVDDATHAFIAQFVVPMMRDVLRKMAMNSGDRRAVVPVLPDAPRTVLPFPTPSLTGKISWHEPSRSWRIFTKESKLGEITTTDLQVDRGPASPAKRRKYNEACVLWNNTDMSGRRRIRVRMDLNK